MNYKESLQRDIAAHVEEVNVLTGNGAGSLQSALEKRQICRSRAKGMELRVPHFRSKKAVGHLDKGEPLNKADTYAKASAGYGEQIDLYELAEKEKEVAQDAVVVIFERLDVVKHLISLEQTLSKVV